MTSEQKKEMRRLEFLRKRLVIKNEELALLEILRSQRTGETFVEDRRRAEQDFEASEEKRSKRIEHTVSPRKFA